MSIDPSTTMVFFGTRHGNRNPEKFVNVPNRNWGQEGDLELTSVCFWTGLLRKACFANICIIELLIQIYSLVCSSDTFSKIFHFSFFSIIQSNHVPVLCLTNQHRQVLITLTKFFFSIGSCRIAFKFSS